MQKIVTFEIAKALKEAGYPQGKENTAYYNEEGMLVKPCVFCGGKEIADAPTYIKVWLWLWREKGIYIHVGFDCCISFNKEDYIPIILMVDDPEEAISKAIEYLVNNNLLV